MAHSVTVGGVVYTLPGLGDTDWSTQVNAWMDAVSAASATGTNTGDVTLGAVGAAPNTKGASLAGQVLTLQPADATHPGVLAAADWVTFNAKAGLSAPAFTSVPSATGVAVTPGAGTGITVNYNGDLRRGFYRVDFAKEAWGVAAATTADVTVCTLPARARIVGFYANVTAVFVGTGITAATLKVGKSAGATQYLLGASVDSVPITLGLADGDLGTSLARATAVQGGEIVSFSATQAIVARLTCNGNVGNGSVGNLTAGAVSFFVAVDFF